MRLAACEARNLRIAGAPGGRVLVIVGAVHKLWLEEYLSIIAEIAIVPTDTILK